MCHDKTQKRAILLAILPVLSTVECSQLSIIIGVHTWNTHQITGTGGAVDDTLVSGLLLVLVDATSMCFLIFRLIIMSLRSKLLEIEGRQKNPWPCPYRVVGQTSANVWKKESAWGATYLNFPCINSSMSAALTAITKQKPLPSGDIMEAVGWSIAVLTRDS